MQSLLNCVLDCLVPHLEDVEHIKLETSKSTDPAGTKPFVELMIREAVKKEDFFAACLRIVLRSNILKYIELFI